MTVEKSTKILIVYYSLYGHTLELAKAVAAGANSVADTQVMLRRVEEFEVVKQKAIEKNDAAKQIWKQQQDIPVCSLDELRATNGVIFGSPTRFGNMSAQMKQLFDSMTQLWLNGEMEGKPSGVFTSTASTHGGQETTLLTMMIPLLHLGMMVMGVPYSIKGMIHTEARGGTPYGPTTIAGGKGELQPKPEDLEIAKALGKRVAEVAAKLQQ
jgi:NAD(P)H dehydrogenase (quinone)